MAPSRNARRTPTQTKRATKKRRRTRGATAWLVTWEWSCDHARREPKVAAIFSPRWSPEKVREHVELLYARSSYSLDEQIAYAVDKRRFNPYPATFNDVREVAITSQILCGHNPHLYGRKVDDVYVKNPDSGNEQVVWTERPPPDFAAMERNIFGRGNRKES